MTVSPQQSETDQSPHPNGSLLTCMALGYTLLAAGLSTTVALPQVRERLTMSDTVTSLHGSFFGWAMLLFGLLGAGAVARLGRTKLFGVGACVIGCGAALFGTATTVAQSLSGAALVGFGGAAMVVTAPGIIAERYSEDRVHIFTKLNIAPAIGGSSFVLLLAGALAIGMNWRLPTVIIPALLSISTFATYLALPAHVRNAGHAKATSMHDVFALLRIPRVRARFFLQVVQITLEFAAGTWSVVFLRENAGLSKALAPLGGAMWALGMLTSRSTVKSLLARFGARFELVAMIGSAVGVLGLLHMPSIPLRLLSVVVVSFSMGPCYTLGVERMFLGAEAVGHRDAGAVSGLAAAASGCGVIIGPLIVGTLADQFGLKAALHYAPIAACACAALALTHWKGEGGMLGLHVSEQELSTIVLPAEHHELVASR